jgi:hypothetical protein
MNAAVSVPIRSMAAGDAPVNGVFGCVLMIWYKSWYTPNEKTAPHVVNVMKNVEAQMDICRLNVRAAHGC